MKLRYVLGLSLLAATVAFTSCSKDEKKDDNKKKEQNDNKDNKDNKEEQATLDQVAGAYQTEDGKTFMVLKDGQKLKFFNPPLEVFFTLGETKDGVASLKGETSDKIVKAEGKFMVKDKKIELTIQEKGKDAETRKGTRNGDAQIGG